MNKKEALKILKKRLRFNQLLLTLGIFLSIIFAVTKTDEMYWAVIFLTITSFTLYIINKSKEDIFLLNEDNFQSIKGEVIDYFPTRKNNNEYVLFLKTEKNIEEFITYYNIDINKKDFIELKYTKNLKLPIEYKLQKS